MDKEYDQIEDSPYEIDMEIKQSRINIERTKRSLRIAKMKMSRLENYNKAQYDKISHLSGLLKKIKKEEEKWN